MSPLRQRMKPSATGVAVLLLVLLWVAADVSRDPKHQLSARAYLWGIRVYQELGRPVLEGRIKCRYKPSCSEYSSEAVQRYGILAGLLRTADRVGRCRQGVPMGTRDPLPSVSVRSVSR